MKFIGMIHLKALPGYPQHKSMGYVIENALDDAIALQEGGADAVLVENSDDDPHTKIVGQEIIAAFTLVIEKIKERINLPIGICVLWNDYKAALAIAKVTNCNFIRVPVFTEAVVTASGIIEANPYDVISYRDKIKANSVKIMADVQVKHAKMLAQRDIIQSAKEVIHFGADEIIVTGKFTGDAPNLEELKKIREECPNAIIVIGSGTTSGNFHKLFQYANKFIIGTSIKTNGKVDVGKVKGFANV